MWNSTQNRSKSALKKKRNKTKSKCYERISWWIVLSLRVSVRLYRNYICTKFLLMIFIWFGVLICHEIITRSRMVVQVQHFVNCCFHSVCKIPLNCHSRDSQHSNSFREICYGSANCRSTSNSQFLIKFFRLFLTQVER